MSQHEAQYIFPCLIAAISSAMLAIYLWPRRRMPGAGGLLGIALSMAVWSLASTMRMASAGLGAKVFWAKVVYVGVTALPVLWLVFALQYTGREKFLTPKKLALLSLIPALTLALALTNDAHQLIHRGISLDATGPFPVIRGTHGPWFWVFAAYAYLLLAVGARLLWQQASRFWRQYRGQVAALLLGVAIPWASNAVYLAGLSPFWFDPTPPAFTLTALIVAIGIWRFRLLGLVPVSRDAIIQGVREGLIILDPAGRILNVNPAARRILGWRQPGAVGLAYADLLGGRGQAVDLTRPSQEISLEGRHYEQAVSPLYYQEDLLAGWMVSLHDITEHKQAEEAVRQSQQRYGAIVDSIDSILWELNAETMRFTFVSRQAERLLGYPVGQWLAGPTFWPDHIHPEDREWAVRYCNDKAARGEDHDFEYRMTAADGRVVWLRDIVTVVPASGSDPRRLRGLMIDITERKQAEEALRHGEERYRELFEQALAGNYVSTPDGRLLAANPGFARIFGFASVGEAMAGNTYALYPDPRVREDFLRLLRQYGRVENFAVEFRRRDGAPVHVVENAIGAFDPAGELVEIRGYMYDDTERRRLEEQLRQAQKMEAVGRLAGGIAHDFNNLMTTVTGFADLLLLRVDGDETSRRYAEEIIKAGERAAALTGQLLAFSRRQMLQPRVLDLNAVIQNSVGMLRRLIGEDIELVTDLAPGLGRVRADLVQVEQVILNLAVNARDAMAGGGRFTVTTANYELEDEHGDRRAGLPPGPYVEMTVSDTGVGMDEETLSHVFEPFFTTKEVGKGTGLGLSTVYGIVKQSGGDIAVHSRVGAGTTFRIYLPHVEEAASESAAWAGRGALPRGSETILLVEDEESVRRLAREVLTGSGYQVIEAADGEAALSACKRRDGTIHLMITDVVMPRMSGPELARRMAHFYPRMQVLYMSGYLDARADSHRLPGHAPAFLPKPFPPRSPGAKGARTAR